MSGPSARLIADSISPEGVRLTTIEATMHRFVLSELNTHRLFSRNSASSRAVPVTKQIARVMADPAMPVEFGGKQSGMQAGPALHLPYIDAQDRAAIDDPVVLRKISAARCGRVSYLNHDGVRDIDDDLRLYERFVTAEPAHASPLEHVATPAVESNASAGNFRSWTQLRHLVLTP